MQLINGRTPEQWAAYDRAKVVGALALALLLVLLWLAGRGPGRAAACCAVPGAPSAAVAPPVKVAPEASAPIAPEATPAPAPTPGCSDAMSVELRFATNSAELTAGDRSAIDRIVPCLAEGRFEVSGHADASGTDAINEPLSEARARSVRSYLVSRGIDGARLEARGYGSSRPITENSTPEGRARNRRVELRPH
jgi:outer membrane protein OmpA-like peptidoglycan-associated protein